jgi:hypothetical protein
MHDVIMDSWIHGSMDQRVHVLADSSGMHAGAARQMAQAKRTTIRSRQLSEKSRMQNGLLCMGGVQGL